MISQVFSINQLICVSNILGQQIEKPYQNSSIATGPDTGEKYISALYFVFTSLTTVGFGNIAPNSVAEKMFSVTVLLLGGMLCFLLMFLLFLLSLKRSKPNLQR